MTSPDRVVLIDGSAFLYRAFFAIPGNFTTTTGIPTNAVYGFAAMFRKLFAGRRPRYGAVVFDAPGRTFRDERFPAYKAQRPRMPSELRAQLALVDELVAAHGFPVLRFPGYEADDVIGTLVRLARGAGHEVHIFSGDKDFTQLIDEDVRMIDSLRDVTWDPEVVRKRWGVPPRQIVDLFALVGDKADNVPGVPGIGLKGAVQLLEQYGSLDEVFTHVDEVKGTKGNALREHRDLAYLSRDLVTIDQHVPLDVVVEELRLSPQEPERLDELYRELQFFSFLAAPSRADELAPGEDSTASVLSDSRDVGAFLASLVKEKPTGLFAVVDEGLHGKRELVGLAICVSGSDGVYLSLVEEREGLDEQGRELLRAWLSDGQARKVVHDVKNLLRAFETRGFAVAGVEADTQLASFLVDPTRATPHSLPLVAKEYLQQVLPKENVLVGRGKQVHKARDCDVGAVATFALERARAVSSLWPILEPLLRDAGLLRLLYEVELP
ncbi:MAG: 5'-3' exonuclease H3TH domain-containing protein, partial [Myxococcota bacterium]